MTLLVSLGRHCQAAHQIGRAAGPARAAQFFDWLTTPHDGLVALLANRFNGFLAPANLHARGEHDGFHLVIDRAFGVELLHDFPVGGSLAARLPAVQAKYAHLAHRFLALPGASCRFIRQVTPGDLREDHAAALHEALAALFGPGFGLIFVSETDPPRPWSLPGVATIRVGQPDPYVWTGDDSAWDAALRAIAGDPPA